MTDKYFSDTVESPLLRQFDTQIAPRINEGFAGVQGFSSRQGSAKAEALGDLSSQLVASRSDLAYKDQQLGASLAESAAQRQIQGVGLAQAVGNAPLQAALGYNQALLPFQQNAQAQSDAQYKEFLRTQPESNPWLSMGLNYIGQNNQIAYQDQSKGGSVLGGALGGGLLGTSGALGAASTYGSLLNPFAALGALAGFFV